MNRVQSISELNALHAEHPLRTSTLYKEVDSYLKVIGGNHKIVWTADPDRNGIF